MSATRSGDLRGTRHRLHHVSKLSMQSPGRFGKLDFNQTEIFGRSNVALCRQDAEPELGRDRLMMAKRYAKACGAVRENKVQ